MRTTDVTQKISKTWEEAGAQYVLEERWREWYVCYMTYTMCKMSKKENFILLCSQLLYLTEHEFPLSYHCNF
jgi:hypothetical protein